MGSKAATCENTAAGCGNKSWTYDGSSHSCGITSGYVPTDATIKYSTSENGTYSTTAPAVKDVADTKTVYYQISGTNFTTKTGNYTCTITTKQCPLTLSKTSDTTTYNTAKTFTATSESGCSLSVSPMSGDDVVATAGISNGTVTVTPKKTGSQTVTVTAKADGNHTDNSETYTLTVNAADFTVTTPTNHLTYNGNAQTCPGVAVSNLKGSQTATVKYGTASGTYNNDNPRSITGAGNTTVYYKVTAPNHNEQTGSYKCYMDRATGTTTIKNSNDTSVNDTTVTGAYPTAQNFTVVCSESGILGTVTSSTESVATATKTNNTLIVTPVSGGGNTTTITANCPQTDNYNASSATFTFKSNNGTISVSAPTKKLAYTGNAQSCENVTVNSPSDTTVTYSTSQNGTYGSSAPKLTNGGSTTVWYKVTKANYTTVNGSYLCTMNQLSLNPSSGTIVYPETTTTFTASCTNSGTISAVSNNTSIATTSVNNGTVTVTYAGAGSTTITVNCAATSDYAATSATYTLATTCGAGYGYSNGACSACASGTFKSTSGNTACTPCSDLPAPAVSGGEYSSVSTRTASTQCRYTAPDASTPQYCETITANTVSYNGSAWGSGYYTVTYGTGYHVNNNTSANPTCSPNTYTVTYNANATGATGTTSSSVHTYDVSKALTSNGFTNGIKKFLGWSTSSTATTATYTNGQSVKNLTATNGDTVNLYAVWGDCTACSNNTGANCEVSAPAGVCTYTTSCKDGYNTIQNGGAYNAYCSANTYSVKYNANATGATGSMSNSSHTYDVSKALTTNAFTNGKKKFLGWSKSSTATTATYTNGQSVSNLTTSNGGTVNLYAVWGDCTACVGGDSVNCSITAPEGVCTYTTSCKAGYYNITNNKKYNASCSEVGTGYYSANGSNDRSACTEWRADTTTLGTTSGSTSDCLCKAGKYLDGTVCKDVTVGNYSGISNDLTPCTNKPAHSTYSGGSTTNTCPWTCDATWYGSSAAGNSSCTICSSGSYCPGNGVRQACPSATTNKRTTFPAEYYSPTITSTTISSGTGLSAASQCVALVWMTGTRGSLYENVYYNTTTGKYDGTRVDYAWHAVKPGYYLKDKAGCGSYAFYETVDVCEAGYYCPGKDSVTCNTNNQSSVHTDTFGMVACEIGEFNADRGSTSWEACMPCANGSYSDTEGSAACTACEPGMRNEDSGNDVCDIQCEGYGTYVASWEIPTWNSDNTVDNLCEVKTYSGYMITYKPGQGGSGSNQTQNIEYNSEFTTKPANTFSKNHASFAAWDCDYPAANTSYTYLTVGNTVCTATWTCNTGYTLNSNTGACDANTYTVRYYANATGATGSMSNSTHTYDTAKALTTNAFTNGVRKFLGWSTSNAATTPTYTNGQSVTNLTSTDGATVNLFAVWGDCTACTTDASASCTLTAPAGICTYTTSCNPGYYGQTNSGAYNPSCTICNVGSYCTGDGTKQNCPDPETHKRTTFPANYYGGNTVTSSVFASGITGRESIEQCEVQNWISGTRGILNEHATYNTSSQKYDIRKSSKWTDVNAGYYLTGKNTCGSWAYYNDALPCPDGSYCPGKARVSCNSGNEATVHTATFGLESCPANYNHSADNSDDINDCYLTTTAGNYVATAGAGETTCLENNYCTGNIVIHYDETGGMTACANGLYSAAGMWESGQCGRILHVGDHEIYLRSDKKTTPSLNIKIGNDTYYGNMHQKTGNVSGHLHLKYNNQTYVVCDESGNTCSGI